jgi:hypothetical protein
MAPKKTEASDLYAQLDAIKTTRKGGSSGSDAVDKFVKSARQQISKVDVAIADTAAGRNPDDKLSPKGDWFLRSATGFDVKFGRAKIKTPSGNEWFKAADLEGVKKILNIGITLAQTDEAFQKQIRDASAASAKRRAAAKK